MRINKESQVGIMIFSVIAILIVLTLRAGDFDFSKTGYALEVHFLNVDGVSINAPVMLNGLEVGQVKAIDIKEIENQTKMALTIFLDDKAKIREGAEAYVKNMGFLGEKYVGLTSGEAGANYLTPGSIVNGTEPVDLDKILLEGKEIAKNLKEISANVNERLTLNRDHIDEIFKNLDSGVESFASLTKNLDERLDKNKTNIDDIIGNMRRASLNLDEMTYDLKANPWKLLYRDKKK